MVEVQEGQLLVFFSQHNEECVKKIQKFGKVVNHNKKFTLFGVRGVQPEEVGHVEPKERQR